MGCYFSKLRVHSRAPPTSPALLLGHLPGPPGPPPTPPISPLVLSAPSSVSPVENSDVDIDQATLSASNSSGESQHASLNEVINPGLLSYIETGQAVEVEALRSPTTVSAPVSHSHAASHDSGDLVSLLEVTPGLRPYLFGNAEVEPVSRTVSPVEVNHEEVSQVALTPSMLLLPSAQGPRRPSIGETGAISGHETAQLPRIASVKYGDLQVRGQNFTRWMENPDDSTCQVSPSVLTYGSLETFYSSLVDIPRPISRIHFGQERLLNHIVGLGLPDETQHPVEPSPYRNIKVNEREIHFEGYVGQGLILIEDLCRKPDSRAPFTSEVCQALYQKHFPIGSLRVIFVMNVLNERTFDFIKESLYVEEHGLKWPAAAFKHPTLGDESPELAPEMKPQVWSRGSPELNALVGTPIGAIIARLILSAFPRGTHRISQVITWPSAGLKWPQTRWDIEPIQRT